MILKEGAGKFLVLTLGVLITIVKEDTGKFFLFICRVLITIVKDVEKFFLNVRGFDHCS